VQLRASVLLRRQPTLPERVLGRRRVRLLRRRFGFVALGIGASLIKPRLVSTPLAITLVTATVVVVFVARMG
jgi:hypothetical protein